MKIATYNVNSVRKRLPIVLDWMRRHNPDVLCLQETKVEDKDFPAEAFRDLGYHCYFRGIKSYNGVATLSRTEAESVIYGFEVAEDPEDARLLQTIIGGIPIMNSYVPQGYKVGTDKYQYKLGWFRKFRQYLEARFDPNQPALWLGDVNVAPAPMDVYHPDRRVNDVDFHIDARTAYKDALSWGFVDVFRKLHPDRVQYTYWDYFRNAFQNNWGWRIDHILATEPLAGACTACDVDTQPRVAEGASDHTVVWAEFKL